MKSQTLKEFALLKRGSPYFLSSLPSRVKEFLRILIFIILCCATISIASAQQPAPSSPLFPLPGSTVYGNLPAPTAGTAQAQFAELVYSIILNIRYIIGTIAIVMILYSGFRMVTGWGNEEVYSKQHTNILYAIIGLAAVGLAGEVVKIFSVGCPEFTPPGQTQIPCTAGGFLQNPNAILRTSTLFNQTTKMIITFIKYFIGSIAVLMIVRNGLRMVTMGSAEDKMAIDKKNLIYSALGLILIILADTAVNQVFYKLDYSQYPGTGGVRPALDANRAIMEIVGFTNYVVAIVGPIAVLALVGGGVMYMTSAGQEERMATAKRLIISALIGIIIMYGAFAIVSTFIAGNFQATPTLPNLPNSVTS